MKSKIEATDQLRNLNDEWFRNIAALRYQRTLVRKHEIMQMGINKRKQEILKTLDGADYDAIIHDGQFSILLGTNGCEDAEFIFGGCSRKPIRKGTR